MGAHGHTLLCCVMRTFGKPARRRTAPQTVPCPSCRTGAWMATPCAPPFAAVATSALISPTPEGSPIRFAAARRSY